MSNNQHCWLAEDDNQYRTISQNTFIQGYLFKLAGRFSLKLKQPVRSFNLSIEAHINQQSFRPQNTVCK